MLYGVGLARETSALYTLYKRVGIALEDIVTVAHAYNLACLEGMGEEIALLS